MAEWEVRFSFSDREKDEGMGGMRGMRRDEGNEGERRTNNKNAIRLWG